MGKEDATPRIGGRCPICGKPSQHAARPFCSGRCADIDLGRWASGGYVISGGRRDADEDGDEAAVAEALEGLASRHAGGDAANENAD